MNKSKALATTLMILANLLWGTASGEDSALFHGVSYVGVSVSDLDQAASFYTEAANLQQVQQGTIENNKALDAIAQRQHVHAESKLLRGTNAQIRLMQFSNPATQSRSIAPIEVHGPGIAHVCYQVAGATETYQRFLAQGAQPIGNPEMVPLNPRNPVDYAYARDVDGIISEIEHIDFSQLPNSGEGRNRYRIRHVSLATPDMERLVAFYSSLLDQPEPRRVGLPDGLSGENFDHVSGYADARLEMSWFQLRNLELEIIRFMSHPTTPLATPRPIDALGYNMIVFDVADLNQARDKFVAAGGSLEGEAEKMDGGEIFFGRDPDGNLLGFQVVGAEAAISSQNFDGNGS